jgi:nucleotide-binding universal stress UspA family protein
MFHKVIVAFDGSEQARDALVLGATLTASDGELIVCCVHRFRTLSARVEPSAPDLDREQAEHCVEEATQLLDGALRITPLLVAGVCGALALQQTAEEQHADLLVLGSSHRGAVGRVLVGSVTEETLHGAPCPVAVAPVGFHRSPNRPRIGSIAVAYDDGLQAATALGVAGKLAAETGAHLQVIAIANTATPLVLGSTADLAYSANVDSRVQMAEHDLAAAIASLPSGLRVTSEVRRGLPPEEILRSSHGVDLLVLGSRGRGPLRRIVLGSVSDAVVRAAACPVLIVPPVVETEGAAQRSSDTLAGA